MPDLSVISAPRFHVQTTAVEARNGFPYFSYHEFVSKLWTEKWRKPCKHSIYPFTDGDVVDFDFIFESLVKVSDDNSEILYKPDEYAKPFFPIGKDLIGKAEQAETEGDSASACNLYLRAAAVFRIARFTINRLPASQDAWERGKAAYLKAGHYLNPKSVPAEIPFTHADISKGDVQTDIPAYMRVPNGAKPQNGWPILLFICGLDAYRTDHSPRTQQHVEHGFATVSFEIPGTGDCPASPNDPD